MTKVFSAMILLFLALNCFEELGSEAQQLPAGELNALKAIAKKLKKTGWNFNVDPCMDTTTWITMASDNVYKDNVTCSCNPTCHIVSIELKSQNLTGVLPEEFADLTSLRQIDLSRNYLNGSIPATWASLPLTDLSLLGNRISGAIPKELGNILTLKSLVVEFNNLGGPLPPELGNLRNLERFYATANDFTGEIPENFRNLRNLRDLRIDGNPISGKIPDFIGNWIQLNNLFMQGTSMTGPIPSNIALLVNLIELRISDLKGSSMSFPSLENMANMETLVLRNCLISDKIPSYIWNRTRQIKIL